MTVVGCKCGKRFVSKHTDKKSAEEKMDAHIDNVCRGCPKLKKHYMKYKKDGNVRFRTS